MRKVMGIDQLLGYWRMTSLEAIQLASQLLNAALEASAATTQEKVTVVELELGENQFVVGTSDQKLSEE